MSSFDRMTLAACGIQQELPGRAPSRQILVRAADLGQRIGLALDDAQLPAATRANRSCSGPTTISGRRRQWKSQKPTTAWERRIRRPCATSFCSREAMP